MDLNFPVIITKCLAYHTRFYIIISVKSYKRIAHSKLSTKRLSLQLIVFLNKQR